MKRRYKKQEEIPENLRSLYEQEASGDWVLKLEEDDDDAPLPPKGKGKDPVKEYRENNIKLQKELDKQKQLLEQYGNLDPTNVQELMKFKQQVDENEELKLLSEGKYEVVRNKWTENVKKSFQDQITKLSNAAAENEKAAQKYREKLRTTLLDKQIGDTITNLAIPKKGALKDIIGRAREVFDMDEDGENIVARDGTSDPDGAPWTTERWATHLVTEEAPFLFEPSSGGGGNGSRKTTNGKGVTWIDSDPVTVGKHQKGIAAGTVKIRGLDDA